MKRPNRSIQLALAGVASALAMLLASAPAHAQSSTSGGTTFDSGSLIVPMSSSWQDACGSVSAYGLIYDLLRVNDGLASYPAGSGNKFTQPIYVHWVYRTTKTSPNRCVPTNQSVLYNGNAVMTPTQSTLSGTVWNDGCDFSVDNSAANNVAPVTLVTNTDTTLSSTHDTVATTLDTTDNSSTREYPAGVGPLLAFPNFAATAVTVSSNLLVTVNLVRYGGGAFVIAATDAPAFLAVLSGKETHKDSLGNIVDFSPFRTKGAVSSVTSKTNGCAIIKSSGLAAFSSYDQGNGFGNAGTTPGAGNQLAYANEHYVNVHRAATSFTAFDTQKWNTRPPRIALLQTVGGLFNPESDGTPTTGIKGAQLKYYLKSAGLDFVGASGCPSGGFNVNNTIANSETGSTNKATFCPNGGTPGQIYDYVDAIDVANGVLSSYQIFWAPHFQPPCLNVADCTAHPYDGSASSLIPAACASATYGFSASNTCVANALSQIGNFLSQQNRGFFGECATIGTFEGSFKNNDTGINDGYNFPLADAGVTQSLTCISNGTGGCNTATSAQPGLIINNTAIKATRLDTCDNPIQPSDDGNTANYCIYYNPQYDFAQIGDFRWFAYSGGTENFAPANATVASGNGSNSIYTNGAVRLAYTIHNNTGGLTIAGGTSQAFVDNFTYAQRNTNTAAVVYLAGHNYTSDVAGTRVALNTVLSLGLAVSTAETAFVGATLYKGNVFVPTYYEVTTSRPPDAWQTYNPTTGSQWHFPYHTGELRVHALANATTTQNYGDAIVYSATNQFKHTASGAGTNTVDSVTNIPATRNLFTYLGGAVTTSGIPSNVTNGIAQTGWKPVSFDEAQITSTSTCVNKFHIGAVTKGADGGSPKTYAGMVAGDYANGAKVCDLQEALEINVPASALGTDYGADGGEQVAIAGYLTDRNAINSAVQLVRMVRGYCFSTVTGVDGTSTPSPTPYSPATLVCNNPVQYGGPPTASSTPTLDYLGGFVHSQVAVIPDSPYIPNAGGKSRPTVAYVGGLDGQLHAFYVPRGDGLEGGYIGPTLTPTALSGASAATVFPTSYSPGFSTSTPALAELWSFIPPGQLPFLSTNQAQVDASPVVIDVFGDFDGDGIRTWHTVLVASAGGGNRELFALDVTNPLAPALLWDLESSYSSSLNYAPIPLTDDDTGYIATQNNGATLWNNTCRAAQQVVQSDGGVACTPAKYVVPSKGDPGASMTGVFNYSHLGASQSVSVAELRHNGLPLYAAFVGTNEPAGSGAYVFSIDLVTGQKLWEWSSPYDTTNLPAAQASGIGNNAPAGVTLFSKTGDNLIDTVYVGDDSGSLWELDAEDGASQTGYGVQLNCSNGACNYALSEAYGIGTNGPQPISTLSTLFYVPTTLASTSQFYNYMGQTLLAYGTGGTDTVSALATVPNGTIHVLSTSASGRYQPSELSGNSGLTTLVNNYGVAKEVSGYPQILSNSQRVFGSIVATGDRLYFSATSGSVANIDNRGTDALQGTLYSVNFNSSTATAGISSLASGNGGIGGTVAVDTSVANQVTVVTITGQKIVTTVDKGGGGSLAPNSSVLSHAVNNVNATATSVLGWILRKTGHDY